MPRLIAVELRYDGPLDLRFTTSRAVFDACDTATLLVTDVGPRHAELTVRIERGRVTEAALWDPDRRRLRLPAGSVTVDGTTIVCTIPVDLVPTGRPLARISAALIVNGALVQSQFPVTVLPRQQIVRRPGRVTALEHPARA